MAEIKIDPADAWKYARVNNYAGGKCTATIVEDGRGRLLEKDTFSSEYKKQLEKERKSLKKESKKEAKKSKSKESDDGILTKILKLPFKLLWWLIKKALIILSLGLLDNWLNSDD